MAKLYEGASDEVCPLQGKLCVKACPTCRFQQQYHGKHPQTNEPFTFWQCVFVMQILLQMEGNKNMYGLGAAIESFRNETVARQDSLIGGAARIAEHAIRGVERLGVMATPQLSAPKGGNGE